jgi:translation initiation factor 2 beta subunit (eIF-2beta)/eIF-5
MININGCEDDFYRYKMEIIQITNGGYGNGQFTIIKNMKRIEKDLNTPSEVLFKYLAYTLGSSYNNKKDSLTGTYTQDNIQLKIYDYINNFVICVYCGIPELTYYIIIKKKIECKCSACGKINILKSHNKNITKGHDLISKYLESGKKWIKTKGTMVFQDNIPFDDFDFEFDSVSSENDDKIDMTIENKLNQELNLITNLIENFNPFN